MTQPIYEFGGSGPVLHLAVANGFPPQTYAPMVTPFTARYSVVSLVPRALWPDQTPPDRVMSWRDRVGADLVQGIKDHNLHDIVAIGHSFGGVATLVAAFTVPQRFRAIVILDPPILPPRTLYWMRLARLFGAPASNGLEALALRRRDRFASADAAFDNFKGKGIFRDWPDEVLRAYVDTLRPAPDGEGVTLAWPKAWEAYYFRAWVLYLTIWQDLRRLRGQMPFLLVRGENSDTLFPEAAARLRRLLPDMAYDEFPGGGHLFPHAHPTGTYNRIDHWLADVLPDHVAQPS